ncbi:MAG: DUF4139 domain-containing protein [Planctomycetes bacterium]|nr:DUF4139 domain-containing protein [Planctomycetota bacterium]
MKRFMPLAVMALGIAAAPAQEADPTPLKIRKIVVYKHGVGYFEREGQVRDDARIDLTFRSAQMKDLLKSLYAVDLSGGKISTIMYDTKDPLSKQLEDILIRLPEGAALTQFLAQLKGARVEIAIGGETATGRIVGIEPITKKTPEGTLISYKLVVFRDDGRLQPLDLLEVSSLRLLDEPLQRDLQRVLDIHLKSKYADRKTVTLQTKGEGERTIRVGYIVETPIWKTSYRLLFEEGGKPLLQGWAILENPTDEDWENVQVSFVAGAPISFIMDLYTAYYPKRPEVPVGAVAAAQPDMPRAPEAEAMRQQLAERRDKADYAKARGAASEPALKDIERSIEPLTTGVEIGELFAYQAKEPVTVKRGQAALVPILSERLDSADRVLYYRASFAPRAANAVKLKNTTSLTLESGPVTFFDGSTCIGEGLLKRILKPGMGDIVPYAFESAVSVELRSAHEPEPVSSARIANGVLYLTRTHNLLTTYALKNEGARDATLYLDHPIEPGYKLAEPATAEEETGGHYRFKLEIQSGAAREFKIRQSTPSTESYSILGLPADTIRFHLQQRYLSDRARAFLESIAATQREIAQIQSELQGLDHERRQLVQDQERARQNLAVLQDRPDELETRRKYLKRLLDADARIDQIDREARDRTERKTALERDLAKKVQEYRD